MVDFVNIYFAGKIIFVAVGTVLQLGIIFLILINGGFKK